jgi:hypothetical protein
MIERENAQTHRHSAGFEFLEGSRPCTRHPACIYAFGIRACPLRHLDGDVAVRAAACSTMAVLAQSVADLAAVALRVASEGSTQRRVIGALTKLSSHLQVQGEVQTALSPATHQQHTMLRSSVARALSLATYWFFLSFFLLRFAIAICQRLTKLAFLLLTVRRVKLCLPSHRLRPCDFKFLTHSSSIHPPFAHLATVNMGTQEIPRRRCRAR